MELGLEWGFIQHEPVRSEITYRLVELIELNGLHYVAVDAKLVAFRYISLFLGRSQYDYRDLSGSLIGADPAEDLHAIDLRQLQIEKDDARPKSVREDSFKG